MIDRLCKVGFVREWISNHAEQLATVVVRERLGIKKYQLFQFDNQNDLHSYYFVSERALYKIRLGNVMHDVRKARVSFNYLLSNECHVYLINQTYFDIANAKSDIF